MMGDNDGSSNAAQGARQTGQTGDTGATQAGPDTRRQVNGTTHARPGFLRRVFGWMNGTADGQPRPAPGGADAMQRPTHGILNLRRMRVEDVAIPKADIIAVPITIARDDLAKVFRETGLTRIPVFDGTLDTPRGWRI